MGLGWVNGVEEIVRRDGEWHEMAVKLLAWSPGGKSAIEQSAEVSSTNWRKEEQKGPVGVSLEFNQEGIIY